MSIIGNASLNRVVKTLTNFDVYFNISAESTSNLVQYEIFLDDVSQGITSITPIKQTGIITVNTFASNIGYHTFGVLFTNSAGESEYFTQTIYLDHNTPVLNNFSLDRISRDGNNDFVLHFDIELFDETGISRLKLTNISNGDFNEYTIPYSIKNYSDTITLTLPSFYNNGSKLIVLEYEDYSGNIGTSTPISVTLNSDPPDLINAFISKVDKTDTHYEVSISMRVLQKSIQYVSDYSLTLNTPIVNWNSIIVNGTDVTFTEIIYIPISEPAGTKTIYAAVRDNFGNYNNPITINFVLDKTDPEGELHLDYANKIGLNYYANVKFRATDAGNILGYGYQIDGYNSLNWKYSNTPSQIFETSEVLNLGIDGERSVYAQYIDYSGNLSPIYELTLGIDTIAPDCSFEFIDGYKNLNDDFVAKFHVIATDNENVQFIKLYGYNPSSNSIISGQSNSWIRISETRELNDIREIIIPKSESEGEVIFYFQARDIYGNESPLKTANVVFDKNAPVINTFEFEDVDKTTSYRRIFMKTNVTDNKGIIAYRKAFDDINYGDWTPIESTLLFDENVSLDVPNSEINVLKYFKFQVKDVFGNESNTASYPIQIDELGPTGNIVFSGASLSPTDYLLDFHANAVDLGTSNVHFYSISPNDSTTKIWKSFSNPGPTISEIITYEFPRTNEGKHNFYFRFADMYKNESPVYSLEYDLDSISIVGGLQLAGISKIANNYFANVELYAVDNRRVDSYSLNGGPFVKIDPPQNVYSEYLNLPIGSTSGPRTYRVQYKDGFENTSDVYSLTFNLDNENPTANLYANGVSSNNTHYDLSLILETKDNQELQKYKFWYQPQGEPSTWSNIPSGKTLHEVSKTFSIPRVDTSPTFEWKVVDFFENEIQSSETKQIVTTPPGPVTLSIRNIQYTPTETKVFVDYNVIAANNSTVDKLNITVNRLSAFVKLDEFTYDIPNQNAASGTFEYSFAKNKTYAKFDVYPISDYGFNGPTTSITQNFDSVKPTANATFIGAFEDNYDYILQFHVQGSDLDSGLNYIKILINSYPISKTYTFTLNNTNTVDEIFNVRIDQTHTSNYATAEIRIYDLMGNSSTPITLTNIYLDRFRPAITNVVLNNNKSYNSPTTGVNSLQVPFRFDASDFSYITHYKYSKYANLAFDSTWTSVGSNTTSISISETVNLAGMGFEQGLQTFYVHAKDKFNNIGTAGINFEFDNVPPTVRLKFANRIERETISGNEFFKIPYVLDYSDNYSEVYYKYQNHSYLGNTYPIAKVSYGFLQSNVTEDFYYLPIGNLGETEIFIALEDRLQNKSLPESFKVNLEINPPVIHDGIINNGDTYTTNKDVYVEMNMSDDEGVTESLFSNTTNKLWNDPNWQAIPFAPRKTLINTFTVDLEAIGFVEGTCNVQMYTKDFCQNITRFSNTIIYDKTPPVVTDFYVNNITRGIDTFEIETIGKAYDVISGLNEYFISQSVTTNIFNSVPGGPIIGNTPNVISQTEYINVRDGGMKKLYFQTKDAAGNISEKANTEIYIDNELPVAAYFSSENNGSKYYLTNANNSFKYIVTDDYALAKTEFELENYPAIIVNTFSQNNHIIYDTQTFNVNLTSLADGEHIIKLLVEDHYQNKISVPYKFYLDNTPPSIDKFEIKEIKPSFNGITKNYDVEFNIELSDDAGISYYELYDNNNLVTTVNVNNKTYNETPTIVSVMNANTTHDHDFKIKVFDYATNNSEFSFTRKLHDGSETIVNNFIINGSTSYTTTVVGNETFQANLTSPVDIKQYALTIDSIIDYDSAFWVDFTSNSNNISFSVTESLDKFAVNALTGTSKIYLHVKDECGNIANNHVDVFLTDTSPVISNVTSPVTLIRNGKYYVGNIQFQINDPDSLMEAYAVGLQINPTNFKSILKTMAGTITHQVKIPEDQINGSEILYLQLRDVDGNLSNNYRISVRILDFNFEKFDIEMSKYVVGSETIRVYFETNTNPLDIEYGYQFDNNYEPMSWNLINVLNRNDIGVYYFDFNINVSSITSGKHNINVWLRNKQNEKISKSFEFISEPIPAAPSATLNVIKTEYKNDKKYVWVEADMIDVGVGVQSISLVDSLIDNFESINTIQTKRIIKKFEYDKTNFTTITYRCRLIDAAGTTSVTFSTSVDLSNVY